MLYIVKLRNQWKDGKSYSLRIFCLGPTTKKLSFWHKSFICHLHISQNTPCLSPELLHNLGFLFLLGIWVVRREIEDNTYAKFWGANKVYYGRYAHGELTTLVWSRWLDDGLVLFCVLTGVDFYSVHKNANKKNFRQYPAILTSWLVSKAQFKHWNFYVLNLIPIIIQVNHSCSTVDSNVLRCTMVYTYITYHGKYVVVIMHQVWHITSLTFETKSLHNQNSHVYHSLCVELYRLDLIDSNIDLLMYLIEGIRFSTWKVQPLNWA